MTDTSTPEGTGALGLSEEAAAERLEALLGGNADSDGGETEPEMAQASEEEVEETEADEDVSDDADEETDEDPQEPPTFTVKVNGEDVTVTLDELQRGYSREADYTRKTQALAQNAKAFETEKAELVQLAEQSKALIAELEANLRAPLYDPHEMAQLRWENPAEWSARMLQQQQHDSYVERLLSHKSTVETKLTVEQQRAQQAEQERQRQTTIQELVKARPEWTDDAKFAEAWQRIASYATDIGLTQTDLADLAYDHRAVIALDDAAKWRALQAKKPQVAQKVAQVKTAKPGVATQAPSKVTELTRSKQRLAKTGRVEDAAAAIERILG